MKISDLFQGWQSRPELNSPTNSFNRLTDERYSQNQSIIPKSIFNIVGQERHNMFLNINYIKLNIQYHNMMIISDFVSLKLNKYFELGLSILNCRKIPFYHVKLP